MDQGQGQDQAQGHEKVRQRSALLQLQMALSLVLALTLPPFSIILPRFINHKPRLMWCALQAGPDRGWSAR